MKTCYIVGAGDCDSIDLIKNEGDIIIAADGGLRHCSSFGVEPDIVVGDFDSLGYIPQGKNTITLPVEKDDTDISYAVKLGREKGFMRFVIFGGTGGKRADHTHGNIAVLADISKSGGEGFLVGVGYNITAITDAKAAFNADCKGDISVFSFDTQSLGVYERGLKYSLTDKALTNSTLVGVSNSFTGQESYVSVRSGTLIIYFPGKISDITIDKRA